MITETPQKALLHFSLPLLAGSIFQNLYNVFDSMIVGQMLGKEALSAVGNSYVPMLIVNSVLLGVSSGISILVSQCYGAQKQVDAAGMYRHCSCDYNYCWVRTFHSGIDKRIWNF